MPTNKFIHNKNHWDYLICLNIPVSDGLPSQLL